MKTFLSFSKNLVGVWAHIGWFSGEEFVLFRVIIFEIMEGGHLTIFDLQIAKFSIGFGFYTH